VGPLYVLTGPDELMKSQLAAEFGELVEAELRAFNVERLYGGEASPQTVTDAARTLPMMTDRRVIIVLQAEKLLEPKRRVRRDDIEAADPEPSEDVETLVEYVNGLVKDTVNQTTLVLVLASAESSPHPLAPLNGNARITKALAKAAVVVSCGGFTSEREVNAWLSARVREAGLSIEPRAAQRVVDLAGADPVKLRTDVERVLTFAAGENVITLDHVEAVVAARETSTDDWALVRALENGRAGEALRELRVRMDDGDAPFAILGQIAWMVRNPRGRFPAPRLKTAVDALLRTDIALKSSGGDARALMERLIVELCG
jgi:DNA polymerase III subunit delta